MAKGTGIPRGKGTYASQACNFCRLKKVKCDESRPICGYCSSTGHKCLWTRETARRPRTEAHFNTLRNRISALQAYTTLLEGMVEKCQRDHGGVSDGSSQSYQQFRPKDPAFEISMDADGDDVSSDEYVAELCDPWDDFSISEERDLVFHNHVSPFRHKVVKDVPQLSRFPEIDQNPDLRYVLLVDSANESHYNPDFDWSRHLPSQVYLERREHDKILDKLFKFFTCWCLRIVPALFLRDMYRALSIPRSQTPPKTSHYSPMLHNALLALATAFSDDPRVRDLRSRLYFVNKAKELLDEECQKPNICVVHALSTLASFYSSSGDQMLGYLYFGMSARISQALGLSVDSSAWVKAGCISHDDMLDRNWAHWTTFSQDVCWSLYVGRDFCVPLPSSRQNIPVPFVDAEYDQIPWVYPAANIPPQPNYLSRTFAASCELLIIARRAMDVLNDRHMPGVRPEINDELVTQIDMQLRAWEERLSPELVVTSTNLAISTPHRLMTHLAYWWIFILLHRPFFHKKRRQNEINHANICEKAANRIMELLNAYRSLYSLRYVPITLMQIVFAAGTIFLLSAMQAASGLRISKKILQESMESAQRCIEYLAEIGRSWQCATNIRDILKELLEKRLHPVLAKRIARKQTCHPGEGSRTSDQNVLQPSSSDQHQEISPVLDTLHPSPTLWTDLSNLMGSVVDDSGHDLSGSDDMAVGLEHTIPEYTSMETLSDAQFMPYFMPGTNMVDSGLGPDLWTGFVFEEPNFY